MIRILLIHGPNLNLLGQREPSVYGSLTLAAINDRLQELASRRGIELRSVQFNSEGAIIDAIHDGRTWAHGIVINPGAYSAYSYAIADALRAVDLPTIEVHLSNIYGREGWRHTSTLSPVVTGSICGLGWRSYVFGLEALIALLREDS